MNDGHDDVVARADAERAQRQDDRVGAVGDADRVRRADVGGELGLEQAPDLWPQHGVSRTSRKMLAYMRSHGGPDRARWRTGTEAFTGSIIG